MGCACSCWLIGHVRQQLDFDAAVFGAPCRRVVASDLLIFADANEVELIRRDVVLGLQIVRDSIRTALAKLVVIVWVANGVGSTSEGEDISSCAGQVRGQVVELLLV